MTEIFHRFASGPAKWRRVAWDLGRFALVLAALVWLADRGTARMGYNWQWARIPGYILVIQDGRPIPGPLLTGLGVTLELAGAGLVISFVFGLLTALLRLGSSPVGRILARLYLELVRNTPLLIQIFFTYFVLGPVLGLDRITAAVLALSLFEGAYASEIIRAGIESVHRGQWDAAYSLGLSGYETYRWIILPQAFRRVLPPLTSQAVSLIKDSALVSTIAIYDLTMQGQAIVAETFLTFEIWFTVAAMYLVLTTILSSAVSLMESRLEPGR